MIQKKKAIRQIFMIWVDAVALQITQMCCNHARYKNQRVVKSDYDVFVCIKRGVIASYRESCLCLNKDSSLSFLI